MPSKKRITREAIIQAAVEILRKEGYERVNARKIALKLKCSTQPIYSEFENMEGLKAEFKKEAERCYAEKVKQYTTSQAYGKYMAHGLGYIRFAKEEPQLFRYLYMTDRHGKSQAIEDVKAPDIIRLLVEKYGFPEETSRLLHYDMAIYTYGLAVMLNTNYMTLTEEQIIERLRMEYVALCSAYGLPDTLRKE